MSYYLNHPEIFNGPLRLTEDELKDPVKVLSCFFEDYSLSEIRNQNQEMDNVCLSTDSPPFDDPSERDHLLCYRRDEEKLLEAAFLLSRKAGAAPKSAPPASSAQPSMHPFIGEIDLTDLQRRLFDIQYKMAQVCTIVSVAFSAGVDKLLKP